jgi:hypothetical protein
MTAKDYVIEQTGEDIWNLSLSGLLVIDYLERFGQIKVKEALELAAQEVDFTDETWQAYSEFPTLKIDVSKESITDVINLIKF